MGAARAEEDSSRCHHDVTSSPGDCTPLEHFHERFDLKLAVDEVVRRFINRASNEIFDALPSRVGGQPLERTVRPIVSALGKLYEPHNAIFLVSYIDTSDFLEVLRGIEAVHTGAPELREILDATVSDIFAQSELDLDIRWQSGKFIPKGAELLDRKIVNDPLDWLRRGAHQTVVQPFEKALAHFLQSTARPEVLSDVITDSYEALEALAKVVTGKNRDLSGNKELFAKTIRATEFQRHLLSRYIDYGGDYRHAPEPGAVRPTPSTAEAEFFLYFTGLFLRLAMEASDQTAV